MVVEGGTVSHYYILVIRKFKKNEVKITNRKLKPSELLVLLHFLEEKPRSKITNRKLKPRNLFDARLVRKNEYWIFNDK